MIGELTECTSRIRFLADQGLRPPAGSASAAEYAGQVEWIRAAFRQARDAGDEETIQAAFAELHQATVLRIWPQLLDYQRHLSSDIATFFPQFSRWMIADDHGFFVDGTIGLHLNSDDQRFSIAIQPLPPDDEAGPFRIYLAGGSIIAIDDIVLNSLCRGHFLTSRRVPVTHREILWPEADPPLYSDWAGYKAPLPVNRYWDYGIAIHDIFLGEPEAPIAADLLSLYLSNLPFDPPRLHSAGLISTISLSWLLAHEECHYRNGHFDLPAEAAAEYDMDEAVGLARTLEWNADQSATSAVVDIFMTEDWLDALPPHFERDPYWMLRFVLIGIAIPMLLIDRGAQMEGKGDDHPSPLARLVGQLHAVFRRLDHNVRARLPALFGLAVYDPWSSGARWDAISSIVSEVVRDIAIVVEGLALENDIGITGRYDDEVRYIPPLGAEGAQGLADAIARFVAQQFGGGGEPDPSSPFHQGIFEEFTMMWAGDGLFNDLAAPTREAIVRAHQARFRQLFSR